MTDTVDTPATPPGSDTSPDAPSTDHGSARRRVVSLVAAAAVVVGVFAVVLAFGVARPPALASVSESTAGPSAGVAWTAWSERGTCVNVAEPDGTVRELYCDDRGGDVISWTSDGIHVRSWTSVGELELVIDPVDGRVVSRRNVEDPPTFPEGEYVRSTHRDGVLVVTLEMSDTVVWEVEAPEAYRVDQGRRSPDGDWVAMSDSARRLLVVPADGSAEPLVWIDDFDTWQMIVWQDTSAATS